MADFVLALSILKMSVLMLIQQNVNSKAKSAKC